MISEAYLMDCMEYMATIPDKWFDLAVVDPPYGLNIISKNGKVGATGAKKWDYKTWDSSSPNADYFDLLKRKSKHQIIWGANHFIDDFPFMANTSCWLIWDKMQRDFSFADAEIAWTSYNSAIRICSISRGALVAQKKIHPTEKPIDLYSWIYANYLPQGGKVIDTHLGSGSNRIAADKTGNIDFYATEIDKDYFDAQEKRWREYKAQTVLTFPERIDPVQPVQTKCFTD